MAGTPACRSENIFAEHNHTSLSREQEGRPTTLLPSNHVRQKQLLCPSQRDSLPLEKKVPLCTFSQAISLCMTSPLPSTVSPKRHRTTHHQMRVLVMDPCQVSVQAWTSHRNCYPCHSRQIFVTPAPQPASRTSAIASLRCG